jgi:L-asparagine transporter-like permease
MIPPTPTYLPPGVPHFTLPTEFSLWGGASTAVQVWNWSGQWQAIIQVLAIVMLVIAGMYIVIKFINQMSRRDSEE